MYKKHFEVRWSEIDPNMHLTSAAYVKYVTDTRMSFFQDQNFGLEEMKANNIGPIVLSEKCYYFKEIQPGEKIIVSLEKCGITEDKKIVKLEQRIFNEDGENCFLSYTLIAFLDITKRKIAEPPAILIKIFEGTPESDRFAIIPKSQIRDMEAFPIALN